ncbi:transcriptional regulator [Labedaea rhizosphaerae]|uniref:Uncharacterized protein n=1 Tax=Labedaea rhizosphaerae TaxID=598644 RepID=A0A4R6S9P9_LABRH|nr:transcriptional regulator [Labedaea rhizosphaerae]TDP96620.1 hypothetical protein EV186_104608 [Labedaea rhizosphaerae]
MNTSTAKLTPSEQQWLDVRTYLRNNRGSLDRAAADSYSTAETVHDTPLLTRPHWIPSQPLPLDEIVLSLDTAAAPSDTVRLDWLPTRADGHQYTRYAEVMAQVAAPAVFENRPTYRLLDANLTPGHAVLEFGLGSYFDSINTGEAAAHEFALAHLGHRAPHGIREQVTDPCDPAQRPVNLAISTLTIRNEPDTGDKTFLLHWRDPRKVGHAGGMYQAIPVGIFQQSGRPQWNIDNDFSLWRNMVREFAEELHGDDEDHGSEQAPIDYGSWPFAARLDQARDDAQLRVYCLGLGVDPLTFATDLLTVAIIDAPVFDELFGSAGATNAEGRVLQRRPFTTASVADTLRTDPLQAAGAALLRLAIDARLH